MNYQTSQSIYGIPTGISYGQNERVDELNTRISMRTVSDSILEPNFDPRPTPTKYSRFPIIDLRKQSNEHMYRVPNYTIDQFNPGTSRGPVSGFVSHIHTENQLRNQYFALQRDAGQSTYIPSTKSDLYHVSVDTTSRREPQPHPNLFTKMQYKNENLPFIQSTNIGKDRFHNHTRTQLRSLGDE
jgi:hypothetical protein